MKKSPFIIILILIFIVEALMCYFMVTGIKDLKTDPVKVNECMYSISENYGDTSKYNNQLDYVVIDNEENLLYKTRDGLSETINEAIKTRGLILDLTVDGEVVGKVIFDYSMDEQLEEVKQNIVILFVIVGVLQVVIVAAWYLYIDSKVVKPFKKLNTFATRVAEGNLDLPLTMDKEHVFGEFTEAFDLMRNELKKSRAAERKAVEDKKEMVHKSLNEFKKIDRVINYYYIKKEN